MREKVMNYREYPKPIKSECGCKVSWYYYDNEADARAAADVAEHNAEIMYQEGYDFGYQCPGAIDKHADMEMYRVVIP